MNFAITCILQRLKDFEVHGVSIEELFTNVAKLQPNLLIFEVVDKIDEAKKCISKIKTDYPDLKVLVLVDPNDKNHISELIKLNIEGCVLKDISKDELILAAKKIHKGENYYSSEVYKTVVNNLSKPKEKPVAEEILSKREIEILKHLVTGNKNNEIAKSLFISEHTVLTHKKNIMKKLKVRSTPQLIVKSIKKNLIKLAD